jgi:hypothetical protein
MVIAPPKLLHVAPSVETWKTTVPVGSEEQLPWFVTLAFSVTFRPSPINVEVSWAAVTVAQGSETVSVKPVVLTTVPAIPVTVIGYTLARVEAVVLMVRTVEHVGEHEPTENDAVAPSGIPETENVTACVTPEASLLLIVFRTELPLTTDLSPPLERVKSNPRLYVAVAISLGR